MRKLHREVSFRVDCDQPSGWEISFTRQLLHIEVGLHYGGKALATHGVDLPLAEFRAMAEELLRD